MSRVDERLADIREQIEAEVPSTVTITEVTYEGPELVI